MSKKVVDDSVFVGFHQLASFARDLNTQLQIPEVVIYGRQGHGKSSLLEALLGHPVTIVGKEKGGITKRPVFINVVNNLDREKPFITVKRDAEIKDFSSDKIVSIEELPSEIQKRNKVTAVPIYVQYEYKYAWSATYIDTPGLVSPSEKNPEVPSSEIEEIVLELARPSNRILVCVEEVKENSQSEMMTFAKKVDPKLDRTVFVFNKFNDQLKQLTSTRELTKYLSSVASPDSQSFFTTLPSSANAGEREQYKSSPDAYRAKLKDLVKDDFNVLEQLQYDKRYSSQIGVLSLRRHILELTWQKHRANVPELLKRLRALRKKSEDNLHLIENQIRSMDSNRLRGNAAKFVMQFLQAIEKLLSGTLEGHPSVNGQTLLDEKSQDDAGEWVTYEYSRITFDPQEWNIPHSNSKLYGGQQFERLLAEFKAVADHTQIEKLTTDEIATAAGPQKLTTSANCLWAASEIAQRQIHRALVPLVDQLFNRATYIMKRLVTVVDSMLEQNRKNRKKGGKEDPTLTELEQYPFFTHAVKDLYYKFVEQTAEECKRKCKDEFLCTRLIFWELSNLEGKVVSFSKTDNRDEVKKIIEKLSQDLFVKIRDRITKNVMLKTYNFFFVPMQTDLWGEIQGNITCLDDQQLNELFEVESTRRKMEDAEKDMRQILDKFGERESALIDCANNFSRAFPEDVLQF